MLLCVLCCSLFSYLARTSSVAVAAAPMGCLLPAGIAKDLFISLLQLLPDLLAPDLRVLVVQVLLKLAETGRSLTWVSTSKARLSCTCPHHLSTASVDKHMMLAKQHDSCGVKGFATMMLQWPSH